MPVAGRQAGDFSFMLSSEGTFDTENQFPPLFLLQSDKATWNSYTCFTHVAPGAQVNTGQQARVTTHEEQFSLGAYLLRICSEIKEAAREDTWEEG
jgi:hypothetical protein